MKPFTPVYVPVGVPTFHMPSAQAAFEASKELLSAFEPDFICPEEPLLSVDALRDYLEPLRPDLIVFQNLTFANAAYMAEVLRRFDCPVILWTLAEPVVDGGRLRLNSLTGAYSAANTLRSFGDRPFVYVYGAPEDPIATYRLICALAAARVKHEMKSLRMAAVGHTPQGFGFGRALDAELLSVFGVELETVELWELLDRAGAVSEADCAACLEKTACTTCGFENTPEQNRVDHAKLYKAYSDYVNQNRIGALASRCWPDCFTAYGTAVCAVLSMLNDDGVAAACEADLYGALSMWIGMKLSAQPVFFGDPVSLDESENSLTFWHCGMAACSLARKDTGAVVGAHPNRKIGPAMDFGCEAFPTATVFRVGRKPDGRFRFFLAEGEILDKPKQFTGTSVVVKTDHPVRRLVDESVQAGFEPHFAVLRGRHSKELEYLAQFFGFEIVKYE